MNNSQYNSDTEDLKPIDPKEGENDAIEEAQSVDGGDDIDPEKVMQDKKTSLMAWADQVTKPTEKLSKGKVLGASTMDALARREQERNAQEALPIDDNTLTAENFADVVPLEPMKPGESKSKSATDLTEEDYEILEAEAVEESDIIEAEEVSETTEDLDVFDEILEAEDIIPENPDEQMTRAMMMKLMEISIIDADHPVPMEKVFPRGSNQYRLFKVKVNAARHAREELNAEKIRTLIYNILAAEAIFRKLLKDTRLDKYDPKLIDDIRESQDLFIKVFAENIRKQIKRKIVEVPKKDWEKYVTEDKILSVIQISIQRDIRACLED